MDTEATTTTVEEEARRLLRGLPQAALATSLAADGAPYASLVLVACDHDGAPLLLISRLAEHTRNLDREPRLALLYDGTAGYADPLTGPRLTVLGRAERTGDPVHRARFLARHPAAERYADFGDFAFFRVAVERGHLVAGFGRIHWLAAAALIIPAAAALAAAESGIVAHMNDDHADAIALYAHRLLGRSGDGWRMTGCDREGCDLRRDGETARLCFDHPVDGPDSARAALVSLVRRARAAGNGYE